VPGLAPFASTAEEFFSMIRLTIFNSIRNPQAVVPR
jgi:hypothetical protein